jgi:hypothetical protein
MDADQAPGGAECGAGDPGPDGRVAFLCPLRLYSLAEYDMIILLRCGFPGLNGLGFFFVRFCPKTRESSENRPKVDPFCNQNRLKALKLLASGDFSFSK